jgi:hypothetical protein
MDTGTNMADILTGIFVDAETGEQVERELNKIELKDRELLIADIDKEKAELEAKANARESALAKLADLGLTAEEIAAF